MARFVYQAAKATVAAGWASDDIRVFYVKTGSTCGTQPNANNLAAFTALGEHAAAGREAVTGRSVVRNDPAGRVELHAANTTFASVPALAPGEQLIGAVYFLHTGSDATAVPLVFTSDGFINPDGSGLVPAGGPGTLRPNPTGLAWLE